MGVPVADSNTDRRIREKDFFSREKKLFHSKNENLMERFE